MAHIQAAFNNARTVENNQLGTSIPMMTLPTQTEWNGMSDGQKALWLINRERIDRGVMPLQGLEANVGSVAQYYADYLLDNNTWGHTADGRSPWQRLEDNPAIGACHDFLSVAENIYVFVTSGSSIPLPIERAIYGWMYEDGPCCSWGHRHAILWYPYNDNSGIVGSEGFLGIGRANGGPYQGPFSQPWNFAEMIVMNVFDPCASWNESFPIVNSITRADSNPTSASSVSYIVTFSESITGVGTNDFTLTVTGGISSASVNAVSGSGSTRTVTVNTGSGNGTIRLNIIDDDSIRDGSNHPLGGNGTGNGNFTSGETYTIIKPANVDVYIGSELKGNYSLVKSESTRPSYLGIDLGPVKVQSTNNIPIVASERVAYSPDGGTTWTSHSELMGLPANLVHTSYTFPFYNNVDLNSQLRFGNVGTASTTVNVIIGGQNKGNFTLAPNASRRVSYAGLNAGPVVIRSNGQPIIASLRVAYNDGSAWTSFSEMMGLPSNKLTSSYTFPWYNNLSLNSQLRFGNVGTASTNVTVTIGGQVRGTYPLLPNESNRVSYLDLDRGPVKITSSGNVPIIASMRVAYHDGTAWTDFSEMMGLPTNALSTRYSFPIYDNVAYNSQLRFGNVGTSSTTVTVTIGGQLKSIHTLNPNASQRVSYSVLVGGPVVIQSNGQPIIASLRVAYTPDGGTTWTSFSEMMGLPQSQLTTSYLFPWYNNFDLDTQLRIGVP